MDISEFESIVEGSEESQNLDFKASCNWDIKTLAKDILAFSNVQDGGLIVIGFEDKTFIRTGVDDKIAETYKLETMQDQMANYADPFVNFSVYNNIVDSKGQRFVVIKITEFSEIPTVCRKDSGDVQKGVIYYRGRTRRPESAPVSNSYDMRDILDRAAVKLMVKRQSQGFKVEASDQSAFYKEELGGL